MHCLGGQDPPKRSLLHTRCAAPVLRCAGRLHRACTAPCSQSRRQLRLQAWARGPSPEREVGCLAGVPGAAGQAAASAAASAAATSGEVPAGRASRILRAEIPARMEGGKPVWAECNSPCPQQQSAAMLCRKCILPMHLRSARNDRQSASPQRASLKLWREVSH